MLNKSIMLLGVLITFSLSAQTQSTEFIEKLFNQAAVSLSQAKTQCSELPIKNKQLIDGMANVHKIAKERKNPSVGVFAETDYLLRFLHARVDEVCLNVDVADLESIKIIIATEINELIAKQKASASFEQFIDNIFGTEYSKFLYLAASVSTLDKMHTDWSNKMASDTKDTNKMISNIVEANKKLREELTSFTKAYKLYYEGVKPTVKPK